MTQLTDMLVGISSNGRHIRTVHDSNDHNAGQHFCVIGRQTSNTRRKSIVSIGIGFSMNSIHIL